MAKYHQRCTARRHHNTNRRRIRKVTTNKSEQHSLQLQNVQLAAQQTASSTVAQGGQPTGRGMDDGLSSALLRTLLDRERQAINIPQILPKGVGLISWPDRNREAAWICQAARRIGMQIDAVSLAVSIFDKVVVTTRVPTKYVNCVSSACVHIARKLYEDDSDVDETWMFIDRLQLPYSPNELKRMETSVLGALQWDAMLPNVERFISQLLEILGATPLLDAIRPHIECLLQDSDVVCEYLPSVVALAAVSHVLESTSKQWLNVMQRIIRMCKVDMGRFMLCRERVSATWRCSLLPRPSVFSLLQHHSEPVFERSPSPPPTSQSPDEPMQMTSPRLQATPC